MEDQVYTDTFDVVSADGTHTSVTVNITDYKACDQQTNCLYETINKSKDRLIITNWVRAQKLF